MKFLLTIFFLILTQSLFGQVIYEPVFIDQCTGEIDNTGYWWMSDSIQFYQLDTAHGNKCILPKSGTYKLHFSLEEEPINRFIGNDIFIKDTFFNKRINLIHYISNPASSGYFACDSLANGEIVDYYYSGKKRMEGSFENGQPIDSLFKYFRNSKLEKIFIPNKDGDKRFHFYRSGQIKSITDNQKRSSNEYFLDGKLKEKTSWSKKYKFKSRSYYQSGALKVRRNKKKKVRYLENGILVEKVKCKEIFKLGRIFAKRSSYKKIKYYRYKWFFFNLNGDLERKIVFSTRDFMYQFPKDVNEIKQFMYDEIVFYKDGKEYKRIDLIFGEEKTEESLEDLIIYFNEHKKLTN